MALVGLLGYAAGLAWWGRALVAPARTAPPRAFATWSVTAALGWWVVAIALVGWRLATSPSWAALADGYGVVAAVVAVGFAAQLLFGALSHLIPTVLGGGPSVVRAASAWLDRGALWRVTVVNLGLLVCLLPSPSAVRVAVSVLVLGALVAFLPLLLRAIRAAVAARRDLLASVAEADEAGVRPTPAPVQAPARRVGCPAAHRRRAASPSSSPSAWRPTPPRRDWPWRRPRRGASTRRRWRRRRGPTGRTTRVRVEAHDMSYVPASVTVPYGDRLVIDLVNLDEGSPHDLTFGDGIQTGAGHARPLARPSTSGSSARAPRAGAASSGTGRWAWSSTSSWRAHRRPPRVATRRHPARQRHPATRPPVDLSGAPGAGLRGGARGAAPARTPAAPARSR